MGKRKVTFRLGFPNRTERTTQNLKLCIIPYLFLSESCQGYANLTTMSIVHLAVQHTGTIHQTIFMHDYQHKFPLFLFATKKIQQKIQQNVP